MNEIDMREETDIALRQEDKPLPIKEIKWQIGQIQQLMKEVLQNGHHYGKITGWPKPTLLKPGAEILNQMFHLSPDAEIIDRSAGESIRYQVKVRLTSRTTGAFIGTGIGECSSDEDKYAWRKVISDAEWDATPEAKRRIKYTKEYQIKQIRTNPPDHANTMLKMAKKRALVDAILTATCASDIFTQDIEDMEDIPSQAKPAQKATDPIPEDYAVGDSLPWENPPVEQAKTPPKDDAVISSAQAGRLFAIAKKSNFSNEQIKQICSAAGYDHTKDIKKRHYNKMVESFGCRCWRGCRH